MELAVIGAGYVGLVAGACFAETGNDVICVDVDDKKIGRLNNGEIPIYEPGLEDLVKRNLKTGRLRFTSSLKEGVENSKVIFIAVGTPQDEDGSADLTHVLEVARGIGRHMNGSKVIVDKSTVPVGTAALVHKTIAEQTSHPFEVVSNPEFLKEGAALDDFMKPDRVVIGAPSEKSARIMKELYGPFVRTNHPILIMDVTSAELTKYAANTMLATRVSFMNELSSLCEIAGADIDQVRIGIGTDSRIGMSFLFPGIGYGGSCFPKDVQALMKTGRDFGLELKISTSVEEANAAQKRVMVNKIVKHYGNNLAGKTFAVWGLAFKPRTDDVREAPALVVCSELIKNGAKIRAFDPEANGTFQEAFRDGGASIAYLDNNYEALKGCDALIVCTEWNEFRTPNFDRIKKELKAPIIFDGRNIYKPSDMLEHGFTYYSIGRRVVGKA